MKPWQLLALPSGLIIAVVMALASVSYNATLGTNEPAFAHLPVTNTTVLSALALALDLGMVASVFGALHWRRRSTPAAVICVILFAIASVFSVHSVRGYIALNITKTDAPRQRTQDLYASLKRGLQQDQNHLAALRVALIKANRHERKRLDRRISTLSDKITATRSQLAQTLPSQHISPMSGWEWYLAITLWFFNASCWGAWFGYQNNPIAHSDSDSVSQWLSVKPPSEPQHCLELYTQYSDWCTDHRRMPIAQYSFYARLIELGARKFREGRNGPTKYELPYASTTRAITK
jgi:hypothetical protein